MRCKNDSSVMLAKEAITGEQSFKDKLFRSCIKSTKDIVENNQTFPSVDATGKSL